MTQWACDPPDSGEPKTPGETGGVETGLPTDSPEGDSSDTEADKQHDTVLPNDTEDTAPPAPAGGVFECGTWETSPALLGEYRMSEADAMLDYESVWGFTAGLGIDNDMDGCTDVMLISNLNTHQGYYKYNWLIPGTVWGELLVEDEATALVHDADDHYMEWVSSGDIDGDGLHDEWLFGAWNADAADGFAGAAYVFDAPLEGDVTEADASATIWPPDDSEHFAQAVGAGDANGDGLDDIAVGWALGGELPHRVLLFESPLAAEVSSSDAVATIEDHEGDYFGSYLEFESDLNADGFDDLVPSSHYAGISAGAVHVFYGPVQGLLEPADADRTLEGEHSNLQTGRGFDGGEDANHDGYDDLLIAAPVGSNPKVYLVHGPVSATETLADAAAVFSGASRLGYDGCLSMSQDMDADGYVDIALCSENHGGYSSDPRGAAFLFYGPVSGAIDVADADAVFFEDDHDWDHANVAGFVVGLEDADGDGFGDLLIGPGGAGPAFLFRGGPR